MSLVTSDGILLRSYEYSESSRIFRVITPELGIVSLLAKGVRKRGAKGETPIQTFGEGSLTFLHKPERDLHTLREVHPRAGSLALGQGVRRFVGASLIAELLLSHNLGEGDPQLYEWVRKVFQRLADAEDLEVPGWILSGGWRTLAHMGFPPRISHCVRCDREFGATEATGRDEMNCFDVAQGGVVCPSCAEGRAFPRIGPEACLDLGRLVQGHPPPVLRGVRAHLSLLEGFALHHLSPAQGFRTFAALRPILNKTGG